MTLQEFTYQLTAIKDKLFRFSQRIVGDQETAEDVVQEVVIKLWNQRDKRGEYQNLEAYCMRLTKNLSIDKTRAKHQQNVSLEQAPTPVQQSHTPYQQAAHNDTLQHIARYMQQLPEKQRLVMQLRDVEGMDYKSIADVLEMPLAQVKVNLFRARKTIRQQLLTLESYGLSND